MNEYQRAIDLLLKLSKEQSDKEDTELLLLAASCVNSAYYQNKDLEAFNQYRPEEDDE